MTNGLAGFAAQTAAQAFGEAFDPHGRKRADVELRKQQIEQLKLQNALKKAEAQQAKITQALEATKFDPKVVEDSVNKLGLGFEVQFDETHFNATTGAISDPGGLGVQAGAEPGKLRFRMGTYARDEKGNILLNPDGTRKFTQDKDRSIDFNTKQDMIDTVGQLFANPAISLKQALAGIDLELARGKGAVQEELVKTKGVAAIEAEKEKQKGRIALEKERQKTAGIKAATKTEKAKKADKTIELKNLEGDTVKLSPEKVKQLDKDRKTIGKRVAKELDPDFDPAVKDFSDVFTPQEVFTINEFKKSKDLRKDLKSAMKTVTEGKRTVDELANFLKQEFKLPKDYVDYLLLNVEEPVEEEAPKDGGGLGGFLNRVFN